MDSMILNNSINLELFEKGPTVLFIWKNESSWPVESVSANLFDIFGYKPESYVSGEIKYADCIHPNDLQRVSEEVQRASLESTCNSIQHQPYRYLDAYGKYRWVKDSTRVIRSECGDITHYIGYLVDMTAEVELKAEAELLKERLELAWSATNDGLWDWEIDRGKVHFSDQWKEMIGYSSDEFPNDAGAFFDAIHPEDRSQVEQLLKAHFADPANVPYQIDIRLHCKDGQYKWIRTRGKTTLNPDGTPHRMVGAHMDITPYKESELSLQESEKRWRTAVDGSGDGLWDWNIKTNQVYFSDRWKKMLGFEPDEIGNSLDEWGKRVHPYDLDAVYSDVQKCMEKKSSIYNNKHRVLCKDGTYKWILDRGVIIEWTDQGEPKRMVGTHTDIDENEKNHQALKILQRRYEAIMKYASDGVFIMDFDGNLHECNHMAAKMLGYSLEEMTSLSVYDWDDMIPKDELSILIKSVSATEPIHLETLHKRKDGTHYNAAITAIKIMIDGKELLYASARDITEQKQTEYRVLDLNRKLTSLAENVPGVVYSYQYFPDGRSCFPYASEHIYDIYGVTSQEVEKDASKVFAVIHPDDITHVFKSIVDSFKHLTLWEDEYRVLHPDKGMIWVKGIAKPTSQEDGSVLWYGYIFDITERKNAELVIKSHVAYLKTDMGGIITEISQNFCDLFRCNINGFEDCAKKFIGQNVNILKSDNTDSNVYRRLWQKIQKGETLTHEIEDRNPNGELNWYRVTITPDTDQHGNIKGYIAFYNNIDNEVRFEHDAHTDFLTGLYNRSKFEKKLQDEISRSKRYGTSLSIILVDIDHFKHVNDFYGHEEGDRVLKEISKILENNVRESDIVARWGGEEFVILCIHTNLEGAKIVAEMLRAKISEYTFTHVGQKTASFGVAQYNTHMDKHALFNNVDIALYKAKAGGRNRVEIYENE